jgi:hypothetical protein
MNEIPKIKVTKWTPTEVTLSRESIKEARKAYIELLDKYRGDDNFPIGLYAEWKGKASVLYELLSLASIPSFEGKKDD